MAAALAPYAIEAAPQFIPVAQTGLKAGAILLGIIIVAIIVIILVLIITSKKKKARKGKR